MTMERALSAPGKLFLCGEYAVLWGGTARIAAVGPRVAARVRRVADRSVHLVLAEGTVRGRATPLGVSWGQVIPPAFRFAARTVDLALRAHGREGPGFALALSPTPPGPDGQKLGLGSSARATVLAAEACRYVLEARFDALKLSLLAHASAQGGKGSGGDVATSFAGGILRYRRYPVEPLLTQSSTAGFSAALLAAPPVDLWRLPSPRVSLAYAFTGQSASTPLLIAEVEQRLDRDARARFAQTSDEHGLSLEEGLLRGDFSAVGEAAAALHALLAGLGPLETEGMRRILAVARSHGCAGKLSGAGGGDGVVLFAPDPERRTALLEALVSRGVLAVPMEVEAGLRGEPSPPVELQQWLDVATRGSL